MPTDDIDDLFRNELGSHATPPGEDLWARLQAGPAPEAPASLPDDLFRQKLGTHATPPPRELWERLEDEHLRPRKRRPAAWWPLALAAAVALLLVAGGGAWWRGNSGRLQPGASASRPSRGLPAAKGSGPRQVAATSVVPNGKTLSVPATNPTGSAALASSNSDAPAVINNRPQATRSAALASAPLKAKGPATSQSRRQLVGTLPRPDADAAHNPLLAGAEVPSKKTQAADERQPATGPAVASAGVSAPKAVAASLAPAPEKTDAVDLITVDVRNGSPASAQATSPVLVAGAQAPAQPRRLGARLLLQAGHLARGERLSLAEVTGLPEHMTLQATVAGRSFTKSIQL